jgi:hypothetical protein
MSAIAPARRPSVLPPSLSPRSVPNLEKATGLPRPRLVLVSRRRTTAGRLPFAILVGGVLVMGLIGVLLLHMVAAQDGFRATALTQRLNALTIQEQALRQAVELDSSPSKLRQNAANLGMVPTSVGSYRQLNDGRAIGTQTPVYVAPPAPPVTKTAKSTKTTKTIKPTTAATTPTKTVTTTKTTTTTTAGKAGTTPKAGKTGTTPTTGATGKSGTAGKPKSPKSPKSHTRSAAGR